MAAIDFPASPAANQIFVAPSGVTYQWNGTLWLPIGGTQALYVGDTPPPSPGPNQLWWNSTNGQLFLWYNDGNTTQWVPAMPTLPVGVPSPLGWRQVGRIVPAAGQATVDFPNIPADINDVLVSFDVQPVNNAVNLVLQFYDAVGALDATSGHYSYANDLNWSSAANAAASQVTTGAAVGMSTGIHLSYPQSGVANAATRAGSSIRGDFNVYNIRDATKEKGINYRSSHINGTNAYLANVVGGGLRAVVGAIAGVRLSWGAGAFAAGGSVTMWGSP
jgi:hypothetical protein